MKRIAAVGVLSLLCLSGCPSTGVVCMAGTDRCGNGCADFQTDPRNCGACGQACLGSQVCTAGQCQCRVGTSLCSGNCVVLQSDPKFCGRCDNACAAGQVCQAGQCQSDCTAGTTKCGFSCVNPLTDSNNCGACGQACPDQQSCHNGTCQYDLVAACLSTGQVVGVRAGEDVRGPLKPLGNGPISLGQFGQVLLAADTLDNRLVQAKLPSLDRLTEFNTIGSQSSQVVSDPPYVYVVNSGSHTIQVLAPAGDAGCPPVPQPDAGCGFVELEDGGFAPPLMGDGGCFVPAPTDGGCAEALLEDGGLGPFPLLDGGCFVVPVPPPPAPMPCFMAGADGGLGLVTVGQVDTGANTFPQAVAKLGNTLWVPLFGDFGAGASAGQKVARIDITNPRMPMMAGSVSLTGLDLKGFADAGTPIPRPYHIVERGGQLYVALNNLDDSYAPAGPGMLARIDPNTMTATAIDLGPECLNASAVAVGNGRLFVSCGGRVKYNATFTAIESVFGHGVVALDPIARWTPQCTPGADGGCLLVQPSKLVVRNGRVYLGDQNGGRIFVADIAADGGLVGRGEIQACGIGPSGFSNVADILSLP